MKTKRERRYERGNALIYVLIAIALFAALSMTLGRNTNTSETSSLSGDRAQILAGQIQAYAAQVKSALDQMEFSGIAADKYIFTAPTDAAFETEDLVGPPIIKNIYKVYHPSGGGIVPGTLPSDSAIASPSTDPAPGWYMGRFNNIDWTGTTPALEDVVLVAYQINRSICEKINNTLKGTTVIPVMTDTIPNVFIDEAVHTGTNVDLTTGAGQKCPACRNVASLCVQDSAGYYGFYSVVADQ
jgi:hypothetical protein